MILNVEVSILCDECKTKYTFTTFSPDGYKRIMDRRGWKVDSKLNHYCPRCSIMIPPNVRDQPAGAGAPGQAHNNPDARSAASPCWADFSKKDAKP